MSMIESFEKMLAQGKDNPLLRFSLGSEYLKAGMVDLAVVHLRAALAQDASYSAAWKLLGKSLVEAGSCRVSTFLSRWQFPNRMSVCERGYQAKVYEWHNALW